MVNKPTPISRSSLDHTYITKTLMAESSVNATIENIYISNHDVIRIATEQNNVDFHTVA